MRRIGTFLCAALLAYGCGGAMEESTTPPGQGGKVDQVHWSDGSSSRGDYVVAEGSWLPGEWLAEQAHTGNFPLDYVYLQPEPAPFYYVISAQAERRVSGVVEDLSGSMAFYVPTEAEAVRLQVDQFVVQVEATTLRPASSYDLALLKFQHINGEERTFSVVVRLDEALAGRILTPRDEASHAPGMMALLQSEIDGPDRAGLAGTWKAVVVPRDRPTSAEERLHGTPEVTLKSVKITGDPILPEGPAPVIEASLERVNAQVVDALVNKRYEALDDYINPDCGIYKLVAPGAMIGVVNAARFDPVFVSLEFGAIRSAYETPAPSATLPFYSCELESWSQEGVFATPLDGYMSLSTNQAFLDEVTDYVTPDAVMEQMKRCESTVSVAVANTGDIYKLLYSKVNGRWYLTVIDLVTPCDA